MSNLLAARNRPSTSPWTAATFAATVDLNFAVAPDGTMTAFRLTDSDPANGSAVGEYAWTGIASDNTTRYYASAFVKKTSGAVTFPVLDIRFGNASTPTKYAGVIINTNNGTIAPRPGWTPDGSAISSFNTDYWLVSINLLNNFENQVSTLLAPALSSDGTTVNVGLTGSAIFWNPALGVGSAPPSTLPTAVRWDQYKCGDELRLNDDAQLQVEILGNQHWIRCTLGRDPADGGEYQWETTVPGTLGFAGEDDRPCFIMASEDEATFSTMAGYGRATSWSWGFGTAGIESDFSFHNGTSSANWSGGSHGGQPHVVGFSWRASDGRLRIYIDGVLTATITGVTAGSGKLMFPGFGTGSGGGIGSLVENSTTNFGATSFVYPIAGSTPWGPLVVASQRASRFAADNLPPGLHLDSNGRIFGVPSAAGVYHTTIRAINAAGQDERDLVITIGVGG